MVVEYDDTVCEKKDIMTPEEAKAAWGAVKLLNNNELDVVDGVLVRLITCGSVREDF